MKRILFTVIFSLVGSILYASGPELIWAGGGMKVSNESNPSYHADTFLLLTQLDSMSLFSQPMLTLKGSDVGFDLGFGGRQIMLNGLIVGGFNLFLDYTSDNSHKRLGSGLEVYHERFSGHMNIYLPLTDEKGDEEALPGIDFNVGVPVPNAPFISVWPGFYYYEGRDRENMVGMSMVLQIQPIKPVYVSFGARNDALQAGRDRSELFMKIACEIPLQRLGKDLLSFNFGEYPTDVKSQMAHRVMREDFITYERKKK